ncbi:DEKNAAC102290 [Brettanomyces naardenensis]|uniref:DEKNAAC102290 n=1 Tax=Brettanomyces naardenensis TaxID=13370 RepID=A0A448YKL9_BRENA|nr:DEKNAAC102290 [Brettanomyces naardenensis]
MTSSDSDTPSSSVEHAHPTQATPAPPGIVDVKASRPFTSSKATYQSDSRINNLSKVIIRATLVGALYGALVSIPTELLLRWKSPFYRSFGTRIRVYYHTIIIAYAASFTTENSVLKFEDQMRLEEAKKREELIEWSVANGLYTGEEEGYTPSKR